MGRGVGDADLDDFKNRLGFSRSPLRSGPATVPVVDEDDDRSAFPESPLGDSGNVEEEESRISGAVAPFAARLKKTMAAQTKRRTIFLLEDFMVVFRRLWSWFDFVVMLSLIFWNNGGSVERIASVMLHKQR